jgi:uracil phosphoribosyltransferase
LVDEDVGHAVKILIASVYSAYVSVHLVDHPVAQHTLLRLRSTAATPTRFRRHAYRLSLMIALEATRDLATEAASVDGPLEVAHGVRLRGDVVIVPVLRAGLAMIDPLLELLPDAKVGHIGLQRDEATAEASQSHIGCRPSAPERQRARRPHARPGAARWPRSTCCVAPARRTSVCWP